MVKDSLYYDTLESLAVLLSNYYLVACFIIIIAHYHIAY